MKTMRESLLLLGQALMVVVAGMLVASVLLTAANSYKGDWKHAPGHRTTGWMSVEGCDRVGPVSPYGLGYWWDCEVTVRLDDGRTMAAHTRRSVTSPDDAGRQAPIVEFCRNPGSGCSYLRPGNFFLGLLAAAANLIAIFVMICAVALSAVLLGGALIHPVIQMFRRRRVEAMAEAEQSAASPPDAGASLVIEARMPANPAAQAVYEDAAPVLEVKGLAQYVLHWGRNEVDLPAGRHKVKLWVPVKVFSFGTTSGELAIIDGELTEAVYQAPIVPGSAGRLTSTTHPRAHS